MRPHVDVGGHTVDVQLLFGLPMDACDFLGFALVLCVSHVFHNFSLPLSAVKYEPVPTSPGASEHSYEIVVILLMK